MNFSDKTLIFFSTKELRIKEKQLSLRLDFFKFKFVNWKPVYGLHGFLYIFDYQYIIIYKISAYFLKSK